jgi:hypothetical protein
MLARPDVKIYTRNHNSSSNTIPIQLQGNSEKTVLRIDILGEG